jgi:CDP-4-dehydro-6-deoxyglucose reductase
MIVTLLPKRRQITAHHDQTILDATRQAGVNLPHSCRSGRCGSCQATLVSGSVIELNPQAGGLSADERAQGRVLLCQAKAQTDVEIEVREMVAVDAVEARRLPVRVARLIHWNDHLMGVYLQLPAVEPFHFRAGQYLDLILANGQRRSYSIASPPHDSKQIELHIRKVAGGPFTELLFETLKPNALLEIEGPFGQFGTDLPNTSDPFIFVAGGTGFSPIKALLRAILETRPTGEVRLFWGVRAESDCYDLAWLTEMTKRFTSFQFTVAVSDSTATTEGFQSGLVHQVLEKHWGEWPNAHVVAAGPPVMLDAMIATLQSRSFDLKRLYLDAQGARLSDASLRALALA